MLKIPRCGFSGVGSGVEMLVSPPLSITTSQDGTIWISAFEYGIDANSVTHGFSPEGKLELSFGSYGMKSGEFLYPHRSDHQPGRGSVHIRRRDSHYSTS